MKKLTAFLFALLVGLGCIVGQPGWRPGEMEVKVTLPDTATALKLQKLQLDGEFYPGHAILYVIPSELIKLVLEGIPYQITITNMNQHYAGFWNNRDAYHTYQEIIDLADSLAENFPGICQKVHFGYSMEERQLMALKISDNVLADEPEAEVMFDAGIHGDEIIGPEIVIRFARDLCLDYGQDPYITGLIDNREIWLYLMVNPDGRVNMTRENVNGVDLNRDWGYMWDAWGGSSGSYSQVETQALRTCVLNNQFVIHTSYHSGIEYISYPWSYRPQSAPDIGHIDYLAGLYASASLYGNLPFGQGNTGMYAINGSTKDGNYGIMGSVSWSMEISNTKQPPASQIMLYYSRNTSAMETMIEYAGYGVQGTVSDAVSGEPVASLVLVDDLFQTYTDPEVGDYHKFLLPGTYQLRFLANGYQVQTIDYVTVEANASTILDIQLQPSTGYYVYKVISCQIPDNNEYDEGYTPAVFGSPDGINYSIGKNGWILLDMHKPILDGPDGDLIVFEGDDSPEGFSCYAGISLDGPWVLLGEGQGTTSFDLSTGLVAETRYLRIVDDGDGMAFSANAGFDLDAIQAMGTVSGAYLTVAGIQIEDLQGNNNGRIDPGEAGSLLFTIRNNGDTMATSTIAALSTLSPFITCNTYGQFIGNLDHGESGQASFPFICSDFTPHGYLMHLILELSANDGTYSDGFPLVIPVGEITETWETGDFTAFAWEHTTASPWFVTSQEAFEGLYSARSGPVNDNQSSGLSLFLEVTSPGIISFYRKVSSETGYDFLEFHIDGQFKERWSGETGWDEVSYPVTAGSHHFQWIYSKDIYSASGLDCAWIDYIVFPPHPVPGSTYQGMVTDCMTGNGIPDVQLTFISLESGDSLFQLTQPDGSYAIMVDIGLTEIQAEAEGFERFVDTVTVYGNEMIPYSFCLNSATGMQEQIASVSAAVHVFPNPFSSTVTFIISADQGENCSLEVLGIQGVVVNRWDFKAGSNPTEVRWDGDDSSGDRSAGGMYLFRLRTGVSFQSGKILFLPVK